MSQFTATEELELTALRARIEADEARGSAQRDQAWKIFMSLYNSGIRTYAEAERVCSKVAYLFESLEVIKVQAMTAASRISPVDPTVLQTPAGGRQGPARSKIYDEFVASVEADIEVETAAGGVAESPIGPVAVGIARAVIAELEKSDSPLGKDFHLVMFGLHYLAAKADKIIEKYSTITNDAPIENGE